MNSNISDLSLYFGDDLKISEYITIHNPTIDDIIVTGEEEYWNMVYTLCSIPSDMKSELWDVGIDWMELSDFEYFAMMSHNLPQSSTRVLFGELDFQKFELGQRQDIDELVLFQQVENPDGDIDYIIIDRHVYSKMVGFLRRVHRIKPKIEKAATKSVKKILIEEDRTKKQLNHKKPFESILLPLVSSLTNCAEFKYGINEVRHMPLYAFMDSASRIQIIKNTNALLNGCYSGMIDTSKINKNEFNWMRDID